MAFKKIGVPESTNKGQVPFLSDFLDNADSIEDLVGSIHPVHYLNFGRKGVTINCGHFNCFHFKSNVLYDQLKEAVDVWVKSKKKNPMLEVKIVGEFGDFDIGTNTEKKDSMIVIQGRRKFGYPTLVKNTSQSTGTTQKANPFL